MLNAFKITWKKLSLSGRCWSNLPYWLFFDYLSCHRSTLFVQILSAKGWTMQRGSERGKIMDCFFLQICLPLNFVPKVGGQKTSTQQKMTRQWDFGRRSRKMTSGVPFYQCCHIYNSFHSYLMIQTFVAIGMWTLLLACVSPWRVVSSKTMLLRFTRWWSWNLN